MPLLGEDLQGVLLLLMVMYQCVLAMDFVSELQISDSPLYKALLLLIHLY